MIEYCQSNVDDETRRRLASRSDSREAACLGRCGRCYREAILVVDGECRRGGSHEALLEADATLADPAGCERDGDEDARADPAAGEGER